MLNHVCKVMLQICQILVTKAQAHFMHLYLPLCYIKKSVQYWVSLAAQHMQLRLH